MAADAERGVKDPHLPWYLRSLSPSRTRLSPDALTERSESPARCGYGITFRANKQQTKWWFMFTTLALQALCVGIFVVESDPDTHKLKSIEWSCISLCLQLLQVAVCLFFVRILIVRVTHRTNNTPKLGEAWVFYVCSVLSFAGIYTLICGCDEILFGGVPAFLHSEKLDFLDDPTITSIDPLASHPFQIYAVFIYFSVCTQTFVGPGDISPSIALAKLVVCMQIAVGLTFSTVILTQTLDSMRLPSSRPSQNPTVNSSSRHESGQQFLTPSLDEKLLDNIVGGDISQPSTIGSLSEEDFDDDENDKANSRLFSLSSIRRWTRNYLLLLVLGIQMTNFGILFYVEPKIFTRRSVNLATYILPTTVFLQCCILCLLLFTGYKFVRHQVSELNLNFILQSYIALCISFAGIYNAVYLLSDPTQFKSMAFCISCGSCRTNSSVLYSNMHGVQGDRHHLAIASRCLLPGHNIDAASVSNWEVAASFLYFAIGIMSTAGYGDIFPLHAIPRLLVSVNCLISQLLTCVLFGIGLRTLFSRVKERRLRFQSSLRDVTFERVAGNSFGAQ